MNTRSIQFRLIVWYSCVTIIVLLAFAFYTYQGLRRQLYADAEFRLSRQALQIAKILEHNEDRVAVANEIHTAYGPAASNRFIRILNADHAVFYMSGTPADKSFDPSRIPVIKGKAPASRIQPVPSAPDMIITATETQASGNTYFIETGMSIEPINQILHSLLTTLLYGLPVVVFIISAGGYALIKESLQPVEAIRATAQQITFGNLSNRLPVATTGDAIEHLSVTLNQMLARLEDAYEQARRFSADASHELRTPLAILRGELESMVREAGVTPHLQERIVSVLEETEGLSRITESLFTLSRLDAGEARIRHTQFDLAPLVQSTAEQMGLLAEVRKIKVQIAALDPAPVSGDSTRIKQIVVNLLDNAIKYTPEGGKILLTVSATPNKAVLEVKDNGIGISAQHLPHVFERFYRSDRARSRGVGGAGLGLSIVHSIAQAHGGSVKIDSSEGNGTRVTVDLPLTGT